MSDPRELAGWALAGAAFTFATLTLVRADTLHEASQAEARATTAATQPTAAAPSCPPVPEVDLTALQGELAEVRARTTLLQAEAAALEGQALPWTDALQARVGEQAVRDWLEPRIGQYEAEIESLDCSEYPCIAVLRGPFTEESIQDLPMGERFAGRTSTVMMTDDTMWRVVSLADERLEGAQADRVRFRIEQVMTPD